MKPGYHMKTTPSEYKDQLTTTILQQALKMLNILPSVKYNCKHFLDSLPDTQLDEGDFDNIMEKSTSLEWIHIPASKATSESVVKLSNTKTRYQLKMKN